MFSSFHMPLTRAIRKVTLTATLVASFALSALPASAATVPLSLSMSGSPTLADLQYTGPYQSYPATPVTYALSIYNMSDSTEVCTSALHPVCHTVAGSTATGVVAQDTLPTAVTLQSIQADSGFTCGASGNLVTCSNGTIAAAGVAHINITVLPGSVPAGVNVCSYSESLTNSATISGGASASVTTYAISPACIQ